MEEVNCQNCKDAMTSIHSFPCSECLNFEFFVEKNNCISEKTEIIKNVLTKYFNATEDKHNRATDEIMKLLNF